MKNNQLTKVAAASILAAALVVTIGTAQAGKEGFEKCQGVAKAGQNDCGSNGHGCAGQSVTDSDANEWIYVPEGTCEKIVGGTVEAATAEAEAESES